MYSNIPTHKLIEDANFIEKWQVDKSSVVLVDAELQHRYEEIREELEEFETFSQPDQ